MKIGAFEFDVVVCDGLPRGTAMLFGPDIVEQKKITHHEGPLAGTEETVEEWHPERGVLIKNIGKGDT